MTTQPKTLPTLALQATLIFDGKQLSTLLREAVKATINLAAAVGLMASSLAAHAAAVNVAFTNLGGGINTLLNLP